MNPNDTSEFNLIKRIRARSSNMPASLLRGIGDDCAVFDPAFTKRLMLSSDLLVENIHFKLRWVSPVFLGRKAMRINLSDLAAMGASPYLVLLNLAMPLNRLDDFFDGFLDGFLEECASNRTSLAGGDLAHSTEISIAVTICGSLRQGEPVLRSGAKPGDDIFVIGRPGLSRTGLEWLVEHDPSDLSQIESEKELREWARSDELYEKIKAHLLPDIQLASGCWLQENDLATSMIDVSDGMAADLMHILEENGVGAELNRTTLEEWGCRIGQIPLETLLNGGEDYALLFTASPQKSPQIHERLPSHLPSPLRVGRIIEGKPAIRLGSSGNYQLYRPHGYDHFQ